MAAVAGILVLMLLVLIGWGGGIWTVAEIIVGVTAAALPVVWALIAYDHWRETESGQDYLARREIRRVLRTARAQIKHHK